MEDSLKTHIFNASYLAIFLYGARRICRKVRPISFDDAYSFISGLVKKPGRPIYLVDRQGTYYHVANATDKCAKEILSAIAGLMGGVQSGVNGGWKNVTASGITGMNVNVVKNLPLTALIPPEYHNRIPKFAQALKHAYRESL